jgi:Tfp pilus assembly protein PilW
MLLSRATTVRCRNEASTQDTAAAAKKPNFKKWETKVSARVKENLNKATVMGAVDFKLMYEIIKEVDEFHRKSVQEMMNKPKTDDVVHPPQADEDSKEENIFLDA